MTNKRIKKRFKIKMIRAVKPLKVSPTIKFARWTLLIFGVLYGAKHLKYVQRIEKEVGKKREKLIKIKHENLAKQNHANTINDVKDVVKEFDVGELPPGWEDEV